MSWFWSRNMYIWYCLGLSVQFSSCCWQWKTKIATQIKFSTTDLVIWCGQLLWRSWFSEIPNMHKARVPLKALTFDIFSPLIWLLQVPRRIFETNNATKLVLIVRNPVDRLISDYNQFRSRKLDRCFSSLSLNRAEKLNFSQIAISETCLWLAHSILVYNVITQS